MLEDKHKLLVVWKGVLLLHVDTVMGVPDSAPLPGGSYVDVLSVHAR